MVMWRNRHTRQLEGLVLLNEIAGSTPVMTTKFKWLRGEMAYAGDSKSPALNGHVGSTPTGATIFHGPVAE